MDQIETRLSHLEARMRHMETAMQALLARSGIDPAELAPPEMFQNQQLNPAIQDALLRGNKIEAIKLYREQYGVGLKEAKDVIDAMEHQYRGY